MKLMGTPSKMIEVGNKCGIKHGAVELGSHFYDAGMVAILKLVARTELHDSNEVKIEVSEKAKAANEQVNKLFEDLVNKLSGEQRELFKAFDEAYSCKASFDTEDAFSAGFVAGFRYLMGEAAYSNDMNFYK
ncbi:DUF6809 family protein [Bacillus velezensis]|uniref:DUF6809 family protein n=1 Tax=Bacillus velezensis TaxID=492670 RepID=UPI0009CD916B|nr:DUF6809 family protein [Bacillus velezensis]MDH3122609.1 hypothetical protein [Bacillus velezensis]SLB62328.1 Uncharacterised protein [Mycobacteroides abscessus subsp. massiliense]